MNFDRSKMDNLQVLKCCFCTFFPLNVHNLIAHMQTNHVYEQVPFKCCIDDCDFLVSSHESLRCHLYRKHQNANTVGSSSSSVFPLSATGTSEENNSSSSVFPLSTTGMSKENNNAVPTTSTTSEVNSNSFTMLLFSFYLRLIGIHALPISICQDIMTQLTLVFRRRKSNALCTSQHFDYFEFEHAWSKFNSDYKFRNLAKPLGYIPPEQFSLFDVQCYVPVHKTSTKNFFQYVSILSTLQGYLQHQDVFSLVLNSFDDSSTSIMTDYSHGDFFKTNSFFKGNKRLLRLNMYADEFEVVNPIGSAKGVHKVLGFYFTVENLPTKYLTKLRNIHLIALASCKGIKEHGNKAIMQQIVKELKVLETKGLQIHCFDGRSQHFRGGLSGFSGDNLGIHQLFGYRCCFSSGKWCRWCLVEHNERSTITNETQCVLRTPSMHRQHLQLVQRTEALGLVYGVKFQSVFSDLLSFDEMNSLPCDLMHDFLSGTGAVLPTIIKCVQRQLNEEKVLDKITFFNLLRSFQFGKNDSKNKPVSYINSENNVGGPLSAAQALCFFRLLPLIIGFDVPPSNDTYNLVITMSKICDIVFSSTATLADINHLDQLIFQFLTSFQHRFPENFGPKFHFLTHYPRVMFCFGPLKRFWSMRFEAYHQRLKNLSRNSRNWINTSLTIAKRIQYMKCWEQLDNECCLSDPETFFEGATIHHSKFQSGALEALNCVVSTGMQRSSDLTLITHQRYEINGVVYNVNDIHVITDDVHPVFLESKYLINIDKKILLLGKTFIALEFSKHYHSFIVKPSNNWLAIPAGSEISDLPLDLYKIDGNLYIQIHHKI